MPEDDPARLKTELRPPVDARLVWRLASPAPKRSYRIHEGPMSHITLIRHGQANTGARDEESYDRLSELGKQQAAWLGDHLRATRDHHTRLYCGTLTRHVETAVAMETGLDCIEDKRLNELEYFTLAKLMETQQGVPIPQEREEFIQHLPRIFAAWRDGELTGTPETFQDFQTRVSDALTEIGSGRGPALVVTSGGVIAMAMAMSMDLDVPPMSRLALAIMNTSVHRVFPIGDHLSPVLFNAVPHLTDPDRHFAQTHL